jgi:hypothetical protein
MYDELTDTVGDDHLTRARAELGEPDELFQISRARFLAKLAVGVLLLLYGVVANYVWWVHGPGGFGHVEFALLVFVPLCGAGLLWHMYRNRGLVVLIYPTGLLRLRRGEVDSFPWAEVDHVSVKVQKAAAAVFVRDGGENLTNCWLPVDIPTVKIWEAGLTIVREDGAEARFGPALTDYDRLAEEVQRRTFAALWPVVWGRFRVGEAMTFDDLEVSPEGLRHEKKFLPWRELKEVAVVQGRLSVKQTGKWLPWVMKDVAGLPNPHVLFALIEEARRHARPPVRQPQPRAADHDDE